MNHDHKSNNIKRKEPRYFGKDRLLYSGADLVLDLLQGVQIAQHGVKILGGFVEVRLDFDSVDDLLTTTRDVGVPWVSLLQLEVPGGLEGTKGIL